MSESQFFMLKAIIFLALLVLPGNFVTFYFLHTEGSVNNETQSISEFAMQGETTSLPLSEYKLQYYFMLMLDKVNKSFEIRID